ncbi:MAG: hypothetical protein LBE09_02855, partial [Christensenellaceae bacterium]|nr:hypothetical protein [Christensenellaceae bacterium]
MKNNTVFPIARIFFIALFSIFLLLNIVIFAVYDGFAAQENQAHADENQIANTTVIMDDGTSVALPGKEVLPDK